jgi:4-alpha-glucanotransferase
MTDTPDDLARLAELCGVATSYENWTGAPTPVDRDVVVTVLGLLGVDATSPGAVASALSEAQDAPWRRLLPPTVVVRQGRPASVPVRAPAGSAVRVKLALEDGSTRLLDGPGPAGQTREVDGQPRGLASLTLPDLPLGWHLLEASAGPETARATLVVAPARLELPDGLRAWGWMTQLYSVRSAGDWGIGDYVDLAELVRWSGGQGAGVLLVNPLHAVAPGTPVEPSPYYPASRRFRSPLHLRVTATPEYAAADEALRARVDALRPQDLPGDRVERDPVWTAVRSALELLHEASRTPEREEALAAFECEAGQGLTDFATWCALADRHGVPWQSWPRELHDPRSAAVARAREQLAGSVRFHAWLQLLCDEQLAAADAAARATGMAVGVVHDLAVGVDPGGADAWALQGELALGATVGAPPDSFNQRGQDWRLPPWRPERLAETGYEPFRDMVRSVLRHSGGIRVDHVLGLSRLWWVPEGNEPTAGTYVRYDLDAMLGVLALEASRAGAVVVGEDLGTVEPAVTRALADAGVLGSAVLWFEREPDGETPLPPARWRELATATVTTHDLPTAAGFLTGEHVRVRAELGLLGRPVAEEQAAADSEREALLALARSEGVLEASPEGDRLDEQVLALHALLLRSPARLVLAALGDAVGDLRQPNLPGTQDEYPNWRLPVSRPLAGGGSRPVGLEELRDDPGAARLAALLQEGTAATVIEPSSFPR